MTGRRKQTVTRAAAAAFAVALSLGLGACQTTARTDDGFPSPYGPSRPTPLPDVPGRGLWNPPAVRPTGFTTAALFQNIPQPPRVQPPARSSETPELLTPAQQAARRAELERLRDGHVRATNERLAREGRVRRSNP